MSEDNALDGRVDGRGTLATRDRRSRGLDGRDAAGRGSGALHVETRGDGTATVSSDAMAPQCWQKLPLSDERRPQFWHSMLGCYQKRVTESENLRM